MIKIKHCGKFAFLLTAIFACLLFLPSLSSAQFGKNKVQYKEFKWQFIQTKHFDIYFAQGGQFLAEFAATAAESSLTSLSKSFDYNISNKIPLVVFNSHNEFQQNNILDEFLPEGVGGVTELFKNRVLVPFEGKYEQFRHVIHHELSHAFINDMYYGGSLQNIISKNIALNFPLWFNEGMAEYQSLGGLDKPTDMYIRDAVINNYLPPLEYINGYMSYRGGQSFFAFLADYYGEEKIGILMNNIKSLGDIDLAFEETYKTKIEKLSEKWHKELKKMYWPEIKTRQEVTDYAKRLSDHEDDGGFYNVSPVISPKGDKYAFISNRDDFFDVFIADIRTGKIIEKVIQGNTSSNFEELQVLTPGLSWSPDGRKLAISVKAGSQDAIFLVDIASGDKEQLPIYMNSISSVSWALVDNKLTFVGSNSYESNIYTYDLMFKKLDTLTNDIFSDFSPSWSPDGQYVYFSSDRGNYTGKELSLATFKISDLKDFNKDIYKVNVITKEISQVTNIKDSKQSYPQFSQDGRKMLYVSDVCGISNVYLREIDTSGNFKDRPITNSLNPVEQISLSRDGKKLLFVSLNKGGYDIFSIDNPFNIDLKMSALEPTEFVKRNSNGVAMFSSKTDSTLKYDSLISDTSRTGRRFIAVNDTVIRKTDSFKNTKDSLSVYGSDIKISFKDGKSDTAYKNNTFYTDSLYTNNLNFRLSDNVNPDGSFKVKNYKIRFSPDLVYGNANYSSFYGVQGVAQVMLSDMLGNHRIYLLTSMVIDLKNSDYAVAYYYLPKRIDYGFEFYHTARFILYDKGYGIGSQLYRYRNYGANVNASYPISKFKRLDGGLSFMNISRENLDDSQEETDTKSFIVPSVSIVHDNTLSGYTSPLKGSRYNVTLLGTPKLGEGGLEFASVLGDFRHYLKLGDGYTFAMRFAGGASFGLNPQRFYIGGTDNWINREFENNNIPIRNIDEYAFSVPGLPLRGYNYDRMSGSKYALMNMEFRFPLFRYLIFGVLPLGFQDIMAVAFVDAGTAWRDNKSLQLFTNEGGVFKTKDLLMGMGFGTRMILLNFPFKFDVAWSYDLNKFSSPKYYFSLGLDF